MLQISEEKSDVRTSLRRRQTLSRRAPTRFSLTHLHSTDWLAQVIQSRHDVRGRVGAAVRGGRGRDVEAHNLTGGLGVGGGEVDARDSAAVGLVWAQVEQRHLRVGRGAEVHNEVEPLGWAVHESAGHLWRNGGGCACWRVGMCVEGDFLFISLLFFLFLYFCGRVVVE